MPAPTVPTERTISGTNALAAKMQLTDSSFALGTMTMAPGRAFLTENERTPPAQGGDLSAAVPVGKTIEKLGPDERDFLIESTSWKDIAPKLLQLKPSTLPKATLQTNDSASLHSPS